jgi:threonine/homoserine/homoserine lactone efflux protein
MFGIADFPTFCLSILVFLALPGPGTFALLTSTSKGGFRAGAAATLGIILGDQVLLWLAVAGVATLLATYPLAFHVVQWGGAAYLGWIGLKLLFYKEGAPSPIHIEPRRYLRQAFFITLLNPKAIVFYMAFFLLFTNPQTHRGGVTFMAMALTIILITTVYCLLLCALASAISRKVKSHQTLSRWLHRLAGVFLIGFGIRLAVR